MPQSETQRDYFAELYVAGIFGDAGWSVYFPKRDVGFDFVVSRTAGKTTLLRPLQVKGRYPSPDKGNKPWYGYSGKLTATHPDMVLALPYFTATERGAAPACVAYMPYSQLKVPSRGGFRCVPASFNAGTSYSSPRLSALLQRIGVGCARRSNVGQSRALTTQSTGRSPATRARAGYFGR